MTTKVWTSLLLAGLALLMLGCAPAQVVTAQADCAIQFLPDATGQWAEYQAGITADVAGLEAFWQDTFPVMWGRPFESPCSVEYAPATVPYQDTCGITPEIATGNAFYCSPEHVVMWDAPTLFHPLYQDLGPAAITFIVAHEYGHSAQFTSGTMPSRSVNRELQADCYAGAYLAYAEEMGTITEDDAQAVIEVVVMVGQSRVGSTWVTRTHGTSAQRVLAMRQGYQTGVAGCELDFETWVENAQQLATERPLEQVATERPLEQVATERPFEERRPNVGPRR